MSLIDVVNLTFAYEGSYDTIFENVSFQIDTDWKLGFTGRNGKGKTTFLRLLNGELAYRGKIAATVNFDYFPFEVQNKTMPTLAVLKSISGDFALWELQRELSLLEVEETVLNRPFNTLSNGEQTKVILAALFLKKNNFLLLDEPTNHLDIPARKTLCAYLNRKKGFILVSHDRMLLDHCVDHILSINKANIEIQKGNFSTWQANKKRQDEFEQAQNQKLKQEIEQLQAAAKRTAKWSQAVENTKNGQKVSGIKPDKGYIGHHSAKMMKRSKSIEARREEAVKNKAALLQNIEWAEPLCLQQLVHPKKLLVQAENLCISYGDVVAIKDIRFLVNQGERLALCGKNGSGKSSIIKLLAGEAVPYSGFYQLASNLNISYIPQDTAFLKGGLKSFVQHAGIDETLFKTILRKLGFGREQFEKNMEYYSEGQKKKVLLAKSLCEPAHLYIWDEPLNFMDVISRIQIEEMILKQKPTMIFVEHDVVFCEKVATKQLCL